MKELPNIAEIPPDPGLANAVGAVRRSACKIKEFDEPGDFVLALEAGAKAKDVGDRQSERE